MSRARISKPCVECPISSGCAKMQPTGKRGRFMVVTPPPGTTDRARKGIAMHPASMKMLATRMREQGFTKSDFVFVPAVRTTFDPQVHKAKQRNQILNQCREYLLRFVDHFEPEVIIPLGAMAARQVSGRSVKITKVRGVIEHNEELDIPVLPMLDPMFVLRYPQHDSTFEIDCKTLKAFVDADLSVENMSNRYGDYELVDDLQFLIDEQPAEISFDVETLGLRPHERSFKILSMQFCPEPGRAYMVLWDHPAHPISQRQRRKIRSQVRELLCRADCSIVGQNLKFDALALLEQLSIRIRQDHDTLVLHKLLDENLQDNTLDMLVRMYVPDMAGYNDDFNSKYDKSRMDLVPLDDLIPYGCGDTDAALRLYHILRPQVEQDELLWSNYRHVAMAGLNAFCGMESRGQIIDEEHLDDFEVELAIKVEEDKQALFRRIHREIKRKHARREEREALSFTRRDFLRDILFDHPRGCKLTPKVYTKGTEKLPDPKDWVPSTSSKDHLPYFFEHTRHGQFVMDLAQHLKDIRLLGTNVRGFRDQYITDGKIHPVYGLTTSTGRTSCVRGDQLVCTRYGTVRADQISVGDELWTHRGRWRSVVRLFRKPKTAMWDVRFNTGEVLTCTGAHRLLLESGEWVTLSELTWRIHHAERLQKASSRSSSVSKGGEDVPRECPDRTGGGGCVWGEPSHGESHDPQVHTGRHVQETGIDPIPIIEAGRQESHEGQANLCTRVQGWEGVLHTSGGRQKILRASHRDGGVAGSASVEVAGMGSASHRRGQGEQFAGQFGALYPSGASEDPLDAAEGYAVRTVEEVNFAGVHAVYDWEVADDHSYLAAGVFSHNSRDPNAQNFPARGPMAKTYKKIFIPPEGCFLLQADLSQAELRIAADMSHDPTMLEIYRLNGDIHTRTACIVMGVTMQQFMNMPADERSLARFKAKAVNFGFIYGMGWRKFIVYAKTQYGVEFTEQEAQRIRHAFFQTYAGLTSWHLAMRNFVRRHGYVRSYSGRIRHLPTIHSSEEWIQQEAERQAINSPVQNFASDLGVMALGRMDVEIDCNYLAATQFVHDAIYCYTPYRYLDWAVRTLKWYMESNPIDEWFDRRMGAPIVADVSFGLNGGETFELAGLEIDAPYDFDAMFDREEVPEEKRPYIPAQEVPPNNGRAQVLEHLLIH